LGDIGVDGRLV